MHTSGFCATILDFWYAVYRRYTTLPLEVFTQRNFVADFVPLKLTFSRKNDKIAF